MKLIQPPFASFVLISRIDIVWIFAAPHKASIGVAKLSGEAQWQAGRNLIPKLSSFREWEAIPLSIVEMFSAP